MLNRVVLLVPPATSFTALAFWFGWTTTDSSSLYFGLVPSTLECKNTDYVLHSIDALIDPAISYAFSDLVSRSDLGLHKKGTAPGFRRSYRQVTIAIRNGSRIGPATAVEDGPLFSEIVFLCQGAEGENVNLHHQHRAPHDGDPVGQGTPETADSTLSTHVSEG